MINVTTNGLKIFVDANSVEFLCFDSTRAQDCFEYLRLHGMRNVMLNRFYNFDSPSLAFLDEVKDYLEGLIVLDSVIAYAGLEKCNGLKYLAIQDNGSDVVDLSFFPQLEVCGVTHSSRLLGLETCKMLKLLSINSFKPRERDLTSLPPSLNLRELFVRQTSVENLVGIEAYQSLRHFEIYSATKLKTIEAVASLSECLEVLELVKCRFIRDYDALAQLRVLKRLLLTDNGTIESLKFVEKIPNLQFLSFVGTNIAEGDLSYCERIEKVGFENRKHYKLKWEHFNGNR